MPPGRKSAYFQPTVPLPPQTILSLETELSYFRQHRPLLVDTELRPFSLRNRAYSYRFPIPRRGGTPDRDCLDWPQYPLTPAVGAVLRRSTDTAPLPRARSRQPTPIPIPQPARSRRPTPARQPTPGPSGTEVLQSTPAPHRAKSVRFPSTGPDPDDDNDDDDGDEDGDEDDGDGNELPGMGKVATPNADGLISKPDGEVGRLKRGYSLKIALGWKESLFKSTKELVSSYVEDYLNHALSESKQPQGHVNSLTKIILAHHPGLVDQYRDGWPIHDMIHLRLKYTSGRFSAGQVVSQGDAYPQDPKRALKELREQDKDEGTRSDKGKRQVKRQDKGKGKQRISAAP